MTFAAKPEVWDLVLIFTRDRPQQMHLFAQVFLKTALSHVAEDTCISWIIFPIHTYSSSTKSEWSLYLFLPPLTSNHFLHFLLIYHSSSLVEAFHIIHTLDQVCPPGKVEMNPVHMHAAINCWGEMSEFPRLFFFFLSYLTVLNSSWNLTVTRGNQIKLTIWQWF